MYVLSSTTVTQQTTNKNVSDGISKSRARSTRTCLVYYIALSGTEFQYIHN